MPQVRPVVLSASIAIVIWMALLFVFGGLHFDDFASIAEAQGALSFSATQFTAPAFDGRWQPLKRMTYDAIAPAAALTFWPFAAALAASHLLMAAGVASTAHAIWAHKPTAAVAGAVAAASLNLSAYSIANVGSLHGILCFALAAWASAAALHATSGGRPAAALKCLSALAAFGACLYKESGVMAPVIVVYALWLTRRERPVSAGAAISAIAAPALGVAAYLFLRLLLDIPLIPASGRYATGRTNFIANAALLIAGVLPWGVAAAMGAIKGTRRAAGLEVVTLAGAAVAAVLPSLLLPWQSPNFWYAAVPVTALGTAGLLHHAARPRRSGTAVAAAIMLMLIVVLGASWRAGIHRWGPYSESSVAHWMTFPRHGGRVVWFDLDSRASYGGLARTVGPGDRLQHALRLASGDPSIEAVACISVLVGPPCTVHPGDELYLHSKGKLQRVATPPDGGWWIMP